jgi:hypothetical protein
MNILQNTKIELNDWLNKPFNKKLMYDEPYQCLSDVLTSELSELKFKEEAVVAGALDRLSTWYGIKISTNKQSACSDFHNMFYSAFLRMQFFHKLFQKSLKLSFWQSLVKKESSARFPLIEHTLLLGNAISLGFIEEGKTIAGIISTLLEQKRYYDLNILSFPRYILELFNQWNNLPNSQNNPSVNIKDEYKLLLEEMETSSSERFSELLSNCCDLHLELSGDLEEEGIEFSRIVEILFPTEILMTYQIRKMTVNSISEHIHPLINDYLMLPKLIKNTQPDLLFSELHNKINSL